MHETRRQWRDYPARNAAQQVGAVDGFGRIVLGSVATLVELFVQQVKELSAGLGTGEQPADRVTRRRGPVQFVRVVDDHDQIDEVRPQQIIDNGTKDPRQGRRVEQQADAQPRAGSASLEEVRRK